MKNTLKLVGRYLLVLVVSFSVAFCLIHFGRRTSWYKTHLYEKLRTGDAEQRLHAASLLAQVGAEAELLKGLRDENPEVHATARRGLEHLWFYAAGSEASRLLESACASTDAEKYPEALGVLDRLTMRYPRYAEGWNRRGAVLWQMGRYEASRTACERALALNPNHFGAWQGLGVCQLQMGNVAEACRSLRAALQIAPHDEGARRSLRKCEELLRIYPRDRTPARSEEVL